MPRYSPILSKIEWPKTASAPCLYKVLRQTAELGAEALGEVTGRCEADTFTHLAAAQSCA